MEKKIIRNNILKKRLSLSEEEVFKYSKIILDTLEQSKFFKNSKNIAMYYPFKKEVDLLPLFYKYKTQKNFLFPKIENNNMNFHEVSSINDFVKGNFGIMEPKNSPFEEKIDLFLIPGIAFSPTLYRIGYGGGFYDKFIQKIYYNTILCGISFDIQILKNLPIEKHDQKLNVVITNKEVYKDEG